MKTILHLITTLSLFCMFTACNDDSIQIRFGSGNKGGFYHRYAKAFSSQYSNEIGGEKILVKNTAGSTANIRLMEEGFLDLAIVQGDILRDYIKADSSSHPFAAVAALYTEAVQIVTAAESNIMTVEDLRDKRVSIGEPESGVLRNSEIILNFYGIGLDQIQKKNLNFKEAAEQLRTGNIDAFFCTAGVPTPSIVELSKIKNIRVVSLDQNVMDKIKIDHPELAYSIIPAKTYVGQDEDVITLGAKAILVASTSLPDSIVQKVTKQVFTPTQKTNLKAIKIVPSKTFASTNIPIEIHTGSLTFYKSTSEN